MLGYIIFVYLKTFFLAFKDAIFLWFDQSRLIGLGRSFWLKLDYIIQVGDKKVNRIHISHIKWTAYQVFFFCNLLCLPWARGPRPSLTPPESGPVYIYRQGFRICNPKIRFTLNYTFRCSRFENCKNVVYGGRVLRA